MGKQDFSMFWPSKKWDESENEESGEGESLVKVLSRETNGNACFVGYDDDGDKITSIVISSRPN